MQANDLAFDKRHVWHPYSSMTRPLPTYPIVSASGCKLILGDGRRLVDGMSSWWAAIHGYNHPIINQAMHKQINEMSHVMFGGITHPSAVELCRRLVALMPSDLECIFLADSGSVAIEVAMKMALQYWQASGRPRCKFLALRQGYHGDTLGAMSVCDPIKSMHSMYSSYLPVNQFVNSLRRRFGETWQISDEKEFSTLFSSCHHTLAAVIMEPIVQGAGGMHFYHPEYLRVARALCDQYGILLIADEIATGFGRTGKWLACNHANIIPDILCLGKALTGGVLTLSATLTRRYIAEIISDSDAGCFMHGPTFMGNPLACAAATASLSLLEDRAWYHRVTAISAQLRRGLSPLVGHPNVLNVRVLGAIGVVEVRRVVNISLLQNWFVENGVWIRPFRNLIYLIPPYIISSEELTQLIEAITNSLDHPEHFDA
ncbi:Adenosylmethionine-8-amino-7-oxononanoate aminotransferase (plasmid) [Candidatus Erwinia haradaeae]|uniref:Adenosylmethionine-8-amino-7-oxononanoate aminotransferase n=1 Tax=Candidatus Erwinia haradaeae TaxID=1922217 RepID=A0A451D325_9GAMM|nr:adenosylmethionine--8-amino-7-oxononanoate transaminase [Candidatus Erwinia haradaeae]VFP80040.1 Adenosylmethionine-8-amino-7-oxononanoate aminotransferase [Candidatus Erwinia haradaeae]VFP80077.1 Adenosylmethionine-8-amino-7-oxononanoate aminotransferase [Candidatus Erwinia haradaeae]